MSDHNEHSGMHEYHQIPGAEERDSYRPLELATFIEEGEERDLGEIVVLDDLPSLKEVHEKDGTVRYEHARFNTLPDNVSEYPDNALVAIAQLHDEYNRSFAPLVEKNREFERDYQYCLTGPDGTPVNFFVQVDMVGLPHAYLAEAARRPVHEIREDLRNNMFEIENSLAMANLLEEMFRRRGEQSYFDMQFRASMDDIRAKFGMPIALLAVTEPKYEAMRLSEYGKKPGEDLTDEEVMAISGFDTLMGPEQFIQHIEEMKRQGKESGYLFYARTSDPVAKLKNPLLKVDHPLLSDPRYREIIKAYTLTMNIDNPDDDYRSGRLINDTKEHLPSIGMGFAINSPDFLEDPNFWPHLRAYLIGQGVSAEDVDSGKAMAHYKPMFTSYGAYGHGRGPVGKEAFINGLRKTIAERGPVILQREMKVPKIRNTNPSDGRAYAYIHRNFFYNDGFRFRFLGGFNNGMPVGSNEEKKGRIHGNGEAVWGENLPKGFWVPPGARRAS